MRIKKGVLIIELLLSDSYRIQTCNLLIRSQMLYSVELMSHFLLFCECKVTINICNLQLFHQLFCIQNSFYFN